MLSDIDFTFQRDPERLKRSWSLRWIVQYSGISAIYADYVVLDGKIGIRAAAPALRKAVFRKKKSPMVW
jgi:hypothetical protein